MLFFIPIYKPQTFPGPQHKLKRTGGRDPETGKKMYMCRGGGVDKQEREVMTHRVPVSTLQANNH